MRIAEVHTIKVPEFLVPALYDGDMTDLNNIEEDILGKTFAYFMALCEKEQFYLISKYKIDNTVFIDVNDITNEKTVVCNVNVIIYNK